MAEDYGINKDSQEKTIERKLSEMFDDDMMAGMASRESKQYFYIL